jgi:aryl-alcohol dehydrogenase-like predicted oxidoreductase
MEYHAIGPELNLMSRLGFGCAPASGYDYGDIEETAWNSAVRASLENGINLFDVADVYGFGRAEELLSKALGENRHSVVLASKFGLVWDTQGRVRRDCSPKYAELALARSLRRLRVECITLYQLHWPDDSTSLETVLETLGRFQEQGKIRFIGVSNVPIGEIRRELISDHVDFFQVPYSLLCRDIEKDFLALCTGAQTRVLAHSALARGLLSGSRELGARFEGADTRSRSAYFSAEGSEAKERLIDALREIANQHECAPSAVALRWALDRREISSVLVGIKNRSQLDANLQAIRLRLTRSEVELLSSLSLACPGVSSGVLARRTAFQ